MPTAAHALLARLADHGVEHLFANAGTDFAPLIEALAEGGVPAPRTVLVPHESVAVGMAHGYYLATGRPQAVMVHTNVGLANALMGAINAAADQVPVLLASGRTPVSEQGRTGSRSTPINWGQEMRDQAGMVREVVKWDGELRYPEQMGDLVDRALGVAMSAPRGPVYLGLPRETFCEPVEPQPPRPLPPPRRHRAASDRGRGGGAPARRSRQPDDHPPHRGGGGDGAESPLQAFAERHAIGVIEFWPSRQRAVEPVARAPGL
ncbi:MAG: thiamine pyrophosphate-binding protein [Sphingomonas sp.]